MVGALLLVLVLAVVQLAYALWVRTVLVDAAAEGARYAALLDGDLPSGQQRAQQIAESGLAGTRLDDVTSRVESMPGYDVVVVEIAAPLPVLGPLGPGGVLEVRGRAVVEQ